MIHSGGLESEGTHIAYAVDTQALTTRQDFLRA